MYVKKPQSRENCAMSKETFISSPLKEIHFFNQCARKKTRCRDWDNEAGARLKIPPPALSQTLPRHIKDGRVRDTSSVGLGSPRAVELVLCFPELTPGKFHSSEKTHGAESNFTHRERTGDGGGQCFSGQLPGFELKCRACGLCNWKLQ